MFEKAEKLARSARFDLCGACSTAGGGRAKSAEDRWIYPAVLPDGKTVNVLKVLQTNACTNDCLYCENRVSRDAPRESFTPEELSRLFWAIFKAGKATGLFLSSALSGKADPAMARMIATAEILRRRYGFQGYIHLKVLPGASRAAVERAAQFADRMSVNLEAPGPERLRTIAREKDFVSELFSRMAWIQQAVKSGTTRVKSHTTQFVVGAARESDREIVECTARLYRERGLSRSYYSAYARPDDLTPLDSPPTPLIREHRLYQTDFLLRRYGFEFEELVFEEDGNLSLTMDPKFRWALNHPDVFPVEIQSAPRELLLRVPGIGPVAAGRICAWRRRGSFQGPEDLRKAGVLVKRAAPYLLLKGKSMREEDPQPLLPFPQPEEEPHSAPSIRC
jgi:predicted DNA-binding helix-hairpin-helix protein